MRRCIIMHFSLIPSSSPSGYPLTFHIFQSSWEYSIELICTWGKPSLSNTSLPV
jgi:hypothetical protein